MKRFDVVLAGNIIVDVVKTINAYPEKLHMANVLKIERAAGGLVCNCAASLSRIDPTLKLCAIGVVGDDSDGIYAIERLSETGADLSYIVHRGITSVSDVMTVASTGERTFFTFRGAGSGLNIEDIPLGELTGGIFHVGYSLLLDELDAPDTLYGTYMARLLCDASAQGFITSMDVVSEIGDRYKRIIPPALKYTDLFAVNELEAEKITGIPLRNNGKPLYANLSSACKKLKEYGVRRWAVIHMPEVACGIDGNGAYIQMPTLDLPKGFIKGTVGAGDAFTSALLVSAYRQKTLFQALRAANAVAACLLSKPGAAEAVVPIEEALKLYDLYPVRKVEV